jgi:acetylornithine/succinyldiaminopimelate/putrescine aminotransferase
MIKSLANTVRVVRGLPSKRVSVRTSSTSSPEELDRKYLVRNYNPDGVRTVEGVEFIRGRGCRLFDSRGREYVDWAAGIAVNALGHSDQGTVRKSAMRLLYCSMA